MHRVALRNGSHTYKLGVPFKKQMRPYLVRLRHQGLNPEDVVIASYPRSGSTWLRFILFEILSRREASFESVNQAIPYMGWHKDALRLLPNGGRLIQSHERYTHGIHKAVYVARDVRSVIVSEYRLSRMYGYTENFGHFLNDFVKGRANGFGSSWNQHVDFWLDSPLASSRRLMLLKYEDMCSDIQGSINHVLDFLGVSPDPQTVLEAIRNNDLTKMRLKESQAPAHELHKVNSSIPFIGKGSVSEWKGELHRGDIRIIERTAASAIYRLSYKFSNNGGDEAYASARARR